MIPQELLKNYQGRGIGIGAYGNGGLEKTLAARLLVPPVLVLDMEGGTGPLGPWTRRIRRWDKNWLPYNDDDRNRLFNLVLMNREPEEQIAIKQRAIVVPAPFIDIVSFDVMSQVNENGMLSAPAFKHMHELIINLDLRAYNSVVVDPLIEFSQITQTYSKTKKGVNAFEPMEVKYWGDAQDQAGVLLKALRNYRDQGLFLYLTCSEMIDKDYATDPRSKDKNDMAEKPYSTKGTFNVPGKLVGAVHHALDIQCHARMMTGNPVWVTREEPSTSGAFNWEAKDRTGRIPRMYINPNIRDVVKWVYGEEAQKEIYQYGKSQLG